MPQEKITKEDKEFEKLLERVGWIVDAHGSFNQNNKELTCVCGAGKRYKEAKNKLFDFIHQHYLPRTELEKMTNDLVNKLACTIYSNYVHKLTATDKEELYSIIKLVISQSKLNSLLNK